MKIRAACVFFSITGKYEFYGFLRDQDTTKLVNVFDLPFGLFGTGELREVEKNNLWCFL